MSFNPKLFLDIANELTAGKSEAHYRSIVNRSYYAAFGCLNQKFNFKYSGISAHITMYKDLQSSIDKNERKLGKRLEQIFERRKDADYDYSKMIGEGAVDFSINTATYIIENINLK